MDPHKNNPVGAQNSYWGNMIVISVEQTSVGNTLQNRNRKVYFILTFKHFVLRVQSICA